MMPPDPANDERPRLFPRMSRRAEERLQWAFVIAGLTVGIAFMFAVLDARHWMSLGITLGVALIFIVGAALYRLIVYGRA